MTGRNDLDAGVASTDEETRKVRILVHPLRMYEVTTLIAPPRVTVVSSTSEFLDVMGDVLSERYEPTLIDGRRAGVFSAIAHSQPDLVMLQVGRAEERGGVRAVRRSAALRSVPVLFCTAVPSPLGASRRSRRSPQDGEIHLPFGPDDVTDAIDGLLQVAHRGGQPARPQVPRPQPFTTDL